MKEREMLSTEHARDIERPVRVAYGLVGLIGAWLLASAWVLGYLDTTRAVVVEVLAGLLLLALALMQVAGHPSRRASAATTWVGIGLVIAPVALRYGYLDRVEEAYVNDITLGLVVTAIGWWAAKRLTRPDRPR